MRCVCRKQIIYDMFHVCVIQNNLRLLARRLVEKLLRLDAIHNIAGAQNMCRECYWIFHCHDVDVNVSVQSFALGIIGFVVFCSASCVL